MLAKNDGITTTWCWDKAVLGHGHTIIHMQSSIVLMGLKIWARPSPSSALGHGGGGGGMQW